jgi:hypothetical protein
VVGICEDGLATWKLSDTVESKEAIRAQQKLRSILTQAITFLSIPPNNGIPESAPGFSRIANSEHRSESSLTQASQTENLSVIRAKAGIQRPQREVDCRFRGNHEQKG